MCFGGFRVGSHVFIRLRPGRYPRYAYYAGHSSTASWKGVDPAGGMNRWELFTTDAS